MNEYLYELFSDVFLTDFSIDDADFKRTVDLGKYGKLDTYSLFPGIILAFIDININNSNFSFNILNDYNLNVVFNSINGYDINNDFGDDNKVFISIYDRDNDCFFRECVTVVLEDRVKNIELVDKLVYIMTVMLEIVFILKKKIKLE